MCFPIHLDLFDSEDAEMSKKKSHYEMYTYSELNSAKSFNFFANDNLLILKFQVCFLPGQIMALPPAIQQTELIIAMQSVKKGGEVKTEHSLQSRLIWQDRNCRYKPNTKRFGGDQHALNEFVSRHMGVVN